MRIRSLPPENETGHQAADVIPPWAYQPAPAKEVLLSADKAERRRQIFKRISDSPAIMAYLDTVARDVCGYRLDTPAAAEGATMVAAGRRLVRELFATCRTVLSSGVAPGSSMVPQEVADAITDLVEVYGAHDTLNVQSVPTGKTVVPLISALPTAVFVVPGSQGGQLSADAALTGSSLSTESNEVAVLMEFSRSVLEDSKIDLALHIADRCAAAIAARLDWACFSADGTNDTTDGAQTGIFAHGSVPTVTCTTAALAEDIEQEDLLRLIDGVSAAAIQRGPRFWVHPTIYRKMLRIADGGGRRLIEFNGGEPRLFGYPITTVAQAPSTNAAGQKVIAFGCGQGFVVAIRRAFTVRSSELGPSFTSNNSLMLCSTRAKCAMADASMFATLKLKAA